MSSPPPIERIVGIEPDFATPPVVEVALGAQFQPLFGLRPIDLGPLRDRWRSDYPLVQEQPSLASVSESDSGLQTGVQLVVGPQLTPRLWFLSQDQSNLIQLQHDRLIVNWRKIAPEATYPRYRQVRRSFVRAWTDLQAFVTDTKLGALFVNQVEINYINAIVLPVEQLGQLEGVLRPWAGTTGHHLDGPEQARLALVFRIPEVGVDPVRLYVALDPGPAPGAPNSLLLTLTVRGAPLGTGVENALDFMDRGHDHLVRSFLELTTESMHVVWERRQ